MTEMDYQALVAMSILTWRIIGGLREPVLERIEKRLTGTHDENGLPTGKGFANGKQIYSVMVWTIAFVIGYGAAMGAGTNGDILEALGWWEGHLQELGWALTAGLIASGSAGLRLAEKWLSPRIQVSPPA